MLFGTTPGTIPNHVPYLEADKAEVEKWRGRLAANRTSSKEPLNVGLCWAGNPDFKNDRSRSISLSNLAPLATVPGVRFFSLQKGRAAAAQAKSPPLGLNLIDWTNDFHNFNDAALIANLDLIITVDTSIAHLAGALARPTWVLLSFSPDWRWMLDRDDTPWYPTMRLFRQTKRGDWSSVVDRVATALTTFPNRGR
jgi:hypothetical protein